MFRIPKRIVQLKLNGRGIRLAADHPFFVSGKGGVNAANMPGAKDEGEVDLVVYTLDLRESPMFDPQRPNYPFLGCTAGTPILTAEGHKPIEEIKPGDFLSIQPEDNQEHDDPDDHDKEPN